MRRSPFPVYLGLTEYQRGVVGAALEEYAMGVDDNRDMDPQAPATLRAIAAVQTRLHAPQGRRGR